jgi:hypothetical protein
MSFPFIVLKKTRVFWKFSLSLDFYGLDVVGTSIFKVFKFSRQDCFHLHMTVTIQCTKCIHLYDFIIGHYSKTSLIRLHLIQLSLIRIETWRVRSWVHNLKRLMTFGKSEESLVCSDRIWDSFFKPALLIRITGVLDFAHYPVFQKLENMMFRKLDLFPSSVGSLSKS